MSLEKAKSKVPVDSLGAVAVYEREDWEAEPPKSVTKWKTLTVENIVMVTTGTSSCRSKEECLKRVKAIQKRDMEEGHPDIKYNFLIGEDGNVYEGRGWRVHTQVSTKDNDKFKEYDGNCVCIAFIGPPDMSPTSDMFDALSGLSSYAVDNHYVKPEVKVVRIEGDKHMVYDLNLYEAFEDEKDRVKKSGKVLK